jgi:hypothetical protein
LTKAWSEG